MTNLPATEEPQPEEPEPQKSKPKKPDPKYKRLHLLNEPVAHAVDDGVWPHRNLISTRPAAAYLLRGIARRLHHHKTEQGLSLARIESLTDVSVSSLSRLLRGEAWGSVPIIAQLERHLDIDLWGDEHRTHNLPL